MRNFRRGGTLPSPPLPRPWDAEQTTRGEPCARPLPRGRAPGRGLRGDRADLSPGDGTFTMSNRHKVVIAGAGGMGSAAGLLLRELGDFEVDIFIGDSNEGRARSAAAWLPEGPER